jgi:hypothetical protein
VIDQLQGDPDISETTGSPVDNPEISQVGPSGPEFIDLDEITGLDDPEFTIPPFGSLTGVSTQPGIVEASRWTSVSNPLSELIKIYDDDESPEVSLMNPMHIKEEKGPEKTFSPVPNVQIQEVRWKEQEVKSVLDTKFPEASKTQENSLKDKQGSDEPKEKSPQ